MLRIAPVQAHKNEAVHYVGRLSCAWSDSNPRRGPAMLRIAPVQAHEIEKSPCPTRQGLFSFSVLVWPPAGGVRLAALEPRVASREVSRQGIRRRRRGS
ncbi:hypothetical protein EDF38_0242 [Frigoribacterium sp. PhB160]|nr:hypothetical protein EDF38_0242 [Frigoribacterium sp. PhB160]